MSDFNEAHGQECSFALLEKEGEREGGRKEERKKKIEEWSFKLNFARSDAWYASYL